MDSKQKTLYHTKRHQEGKSNFLKELDNHNFQSFETKISNSPHDIQAK